MADLSVFVVELSAVEYYKFAVTAVKGKIRGLPTGMRSANHWSVALWAKHDWPPV
jgi:hypothetical protein